MSNDRLLELIGRKLSGEATEAELNELDRLLAADEEARARYKLMQQFWEQHDDINQAAIEESLKKTLAQLELSPSTQLMQLPYKNKKFNYKTLFKIAAAVIIVAGVADWLMLNTTSKSSSAENKTLVEKQNTKGVKSTIELADGSKIWLNADSKIQYPKVFAANTREVYLNGEAFFEVAKNPAKPFIIHLANGTIRVLGTSFNVRAYDNEKVVETSVSTGKVAFIPKYKTSEKQQDTVFLTHDKKVRYLFVAEKVLTESTLAEEDKAWTEGKLIFKAMTFEEIAVVLERSFGKKIVFMAGNMKGVRLTGSFENNSLEEIMYYLSRTKEFHYKITGTEVLIAENISDLPL